MKNNKKGFTLAELLIVVAIIAVLVGISIPVFTTQLEKSREATDLANIRAAYAEVMVDALGNSGESAATKTVKLVQQKDGWQTEMADITVGGLAVPTDVTAKCNATVAYDATSGAASITFSK